MAWMKMVERPFSLSDSVAWSLGFSVQAFRETLHRLGAADVLDIIVVSVLLYAGLRALTQKRVARAAQGIGLLGILYIVARQTGMILTVAIFRRFFTVILMAMVVIFQEELRRFFERVTIWPWRSNAELPGRGIVEPIAHVAMTCALSKIGALIVLKGRDPLERHVSGGHRLGGELCSPLLESLFDPHSDGHDGAVLIEGNRVTHFGVHLPLTHHPEQTGGRGTRHAAALGLSEVSDALCIVVSEQKGTISLAINGQLSTLTNSRKGLESRIRTFIEEKFTTAGRRGRVRTLTQHAGLKVLATVLGLALWLIFVQGFKPMKQIFQVPVHIHNLCEPLHLRHMEPTIVSVTLAGLQRDFIQLNSTPLRVFLDLDDVPEGLQDVSISIDDVDVPDPLRVVDVTPSVFRLDLTRSNASFTPKNTMKKNRRHPWLHFH